MDKFLIIDGNSIINRAFYALPLLTNQFGEYSNAVYGFSNILIKAITEYKPKYIAVAFDYGKKTFRNEIFEQYKGTRKGMPDELAQQMPILKAMLEKMHITYFEKENIEADDIIGTLAQTQNVEKIILSGDRDLFQLINNSTYVYFTKKGISEIEIFNEKKLLEVMNLTPSQIVEYKALRGDASDNIPGVAGIGDKTALSLLNEFGNIDTVYNNLDKISKNSVKQKLIEGKEMAYISRTLASIKKDVDLTFNIENLTYNFPFNNEVLDFFIKYDFKSLLKKDNLFCENVNCNATENISYEIVEINDTQKLNEVISYIKEEGRIAFDLKNGFRFACSPNFEYKLNMEISMFNTNLTVEQALYELKPIFENKNILKICFDLKNHMHILDRFNIKIAKENNFDIAIAKYVLTENAKTYNNSPANYFFECKDLIEKMKNIGVYNVFENIDMPLASVLYQMEKDGIKIDVNATNEIKEILGKDLESLTNKIYELAGEPFKINSPKVLSQILFDKLQIKTYNNSKKSTSVDVLNQIVDQHEIVSYILKYRKVQKLLTTYVEPFLLIASKNNGYLHSIFSQVLTSTGRLSSSDPNLQNLPIKDEEGKHLRKLFISRFENGNLVSADYNQVELRLMAHYSQDKNMLEAYQNGLDIHSSTASLIFNKPINEITKNERRVAKTVNFGIIYGISEYGLAQNLNVSIVRAKTYIERYFYSYPQVKLYMNDAIELAKENGFSKSLFGRIRYIPELKSSNKSLVKFGERVAINMPLQGTAADIIKIAMIRVCNKIIELKLKAKLVLQIHDQLVVDCPNEETEIVKNILEECMTSVVNLSVKLPVEINYGKTLMDC